MDLLDVDHRRRRIAQGAASTLALRCRCLGAAVSMPSLSRRADRELVGEVAFNRWN
jgi:hypothetical protein